ncbi:MAG: hypothetical protein DMG90_18865 [Acidobacteria bacterium]|nr:MAG: hypothetical protein DMG90_18865 [Acidobacteriota bacterium]
MLRISIIEDSAESVRLALEGSLVGPWVDEVRKQSETALADSKAVTLDLEKVRFVDASGTALLRELASRKVQQMNCSAFLSQQLKEATI